MWSSTFRDNMTNSNFINAKKLNSFFSSFRSDRVAVFSAAVPVVTCNWGSVRPLWQAALAHSYHSEENAILHHFFMTLKYKPQYPFTLEATRVIHLEQFILYLCKNSCSFDHQPCFIQV